jgi:hypothetical protein
MKVTKSLGGPSFLRGALLVGALFAICPVQTARAGTCTWNYLGNSYGSCYGTYSTTGNTTHNTPCKSDFRAINPSG